MPKSIKLEDPLSLGLLPPTDTSITDLYLQAREEDFDWIDMDIYGIWRPPNSSRLTKREEMAEIMVKTDIRIFTKFPDPSIEKNSDEYRRQAKEIQKATQWMSKFQGRYKGRQNRSPAPSQSRSMAQGVQPHEDLNGERHSQYEFDFRWCVDVCQGRDFLIDFLRCHFPEHMSIITLRGTPTLAEIRIIGNEQMAEGVRQCRRLFNAPVISDTVGLLLYQELRQGESLDHSHDVCNDKEAILDGVTPNVITEQTTQHLRERMNRYIAAREAHESLARSMAERRANPTRPSTAPVLPSIPEHAPGLKRANTTDLSTAAARPAIEHRGRSMSMASIWSAATTTITSESMELKVPEGYGVFRSLRRSSRKSSMSHRASLDSGYW
ncbi:hypothetical protein BJ166DRAFT_587886 [Pestalotiopsis sp. NC0098]|nr:hypothetical protein BJ166DRAFT_587886 [Pestalotiopsis sp. NC0098]